MNDKADSAFYTVDDDGRITYKYTEGISEYWRRNKSPVPATELSRLLYVLRRFAGFLGSNVGTILWDGMVMDSELGQSVISLDPRFLQSNFPASPESVDILAGITIREAYKQTEWYIHAQKLFMNQVSLREASEYHSQLELFQRTAGFVYVDARLTTSVLGLYTHVTRQIHMRDAVARHMITPSWEELMEYWKMTVELGTQQDCYYLLNHSQEELPQLRRFYDAALTRLMAFTRVLPEVYALPFLRERTQELAARLYALFEDLLVATGDWIMKEDRLGLLTAPEVSEGWRWSNIRRPSARTLQAVRTELEETLDLSGEMVRVMGRETSLVHTVVRDLVIPLQQKLDYRLCASLKSALCLRITKSRVISRGMRSGKLDSRHLYRAMIDGRAFSYRKDITHLDHDVLLLVDASSSMIPPKWAQAERVFQAMYEAIRSVEKNTRIFAYCEAENICTLTELGKDGRLHTIVPRGKTPSGEALLAGALILRRQNRRNRPIILHITDGASNWGCSVQRALDYCHSQQITVLTLAIGVSNAGDCELLKKEYGDLVRFVNDLKLLPRQVAEMLVRMR